MTTIFITLGLIITYFIISAIKENETRETIERERRENTKNIANLHYNNMVEQVMQRNKILEESRKIFVEQLEREEGILSVSFEENTLMIVTNYDIELDEANQYANNWINTLIPSTEVDIVKVYNIDGDMRGKANRILK